MKHARWRGRSQSSGTSSSTTSHHQLLLQLQSRSALSSTVSFLPPTLLRLLSPLSESTWTEKRGDISDSSSGSFHRRDDRNQRQLAGGVVMAVGIWTLLEKSDYISLLSSKTYAASAYILVLAGAIVMVTGVLGCCATFKEQRRLLRVYFVLLLCIFLLEILAGVLAYIYYQQLNEELKQNLRDTMIQKYQQKSHEHITRAVDKLQQEFKCCGSNSSADWASSIWIRSRDSDNREVPDSCCKSPTELCGRRSHPSNIYKVEGGCISQLEKFILDHLKIIGAVGVGIACVQIIGMVFTCCLYRSLKAEPY
uniref:Tetraspanin n=1 Tax=Scophthalmus maximus TaxID=52904 RepID=A0A8D3C6V9_SCOMX